MNLIVNLSPTLFMLAWEKIYQRGLSFNNNYTQEQYHNFFSILHNVGCLLLILIYKHTANLYIILVLIVWSQSYYLFDLDKYTNRNDKAIMITHHIASIVIEFYLLSDNAEAIINGLFVAELSNYPFYYVYHITHSKNHIQISNILYWSEVLSFFILRGLCGIYYLFLFPVTNIMLWILVFGFWSVSLYWAYNIYKKIIMVSNAVY